MSASILFRIPCNPRLSNNVKIKTGWQGRNDLDLNLDGVHFETLTWHGLSWLRGFPRPVQAKTGVIPRLDYDRFLPNFFNSSFTNHPTTRCFVVSMLTASWNNPEQIQNYNFTRSFVCVWKTSVSEPKRRRNPEDEIWGSHGSGLWWLLSFGVSYHMAWQSLRTFRMKLLPPFSGQKSALNPEGGGSRFLSRRR
jgi:hypothetical protein